jgi:hypothetical protein
MDASGISVPPALGTAIGFAHRVAARRTSRHGQAKAAANEAAPHERTHAGENDDDPEKHHVRRALHESHRIRRLGKSAQQTP